MAVYPATSLKLKRYENASALLDSSLNVGNTNQTKAIASTNATKQSIYDSPRNCMINCLRSPPTTLRMPISLARFRDRATVRLTKLMQAISKINSAIPVRIYEYIGLLASVRPLSG